MGTIIIWNDLGGLGLAAIVAVFAFGYLLHEFCHIGVLELAGVGYDVEFAPGDGPTWRQVLWGRMFHIEPETAIGPKLALAYNLAPGVLTLPGWYVWALLLQQSVVRLSWVLGTAAWIIIFLPSLVDWRESWRSVRLLRSGGETV